MCYVGVIKPIDFFSYELKDNGNVSIVTGLQYVDILEEVLLPTVRAMFLPHPEKIRLVQDNSPIHKSRVVQQWLTEHAEDIEVLYWPPRSPDLNPHRKPVGAHDK